MLIKLGTDKKVDAQYAMWGFINDLAASHNTIARELKKIKQLADIVINKLPADDQNELRSQFK